MMLTHSRDIEWMEQIEVPFVCIWSDHITSSLSVIYGLITLNMHLAYGTLCLGDSTPTHTFLRNHPSFTNVMSLAYA